MRNGLSSMLSAFQVLACLAAGAMVSCHGRPGIPAPVARGGIIDLRSWDFEKNGPVDLKGEWRYRMADDQPGHALPGADDSSWETIAVPGYWNSDATSGNGYGWYRLRILAGENFRSTEPAVYLKGANTAYEMFINGRRVMGAGTVGKDRAASVPGLVPQVRQFFPDDPQGGIVIAVRISNFHHRGGGMNKIPRIGPFGMLCHDTWINDVSESIVLGFILMMSLYHVILWLGRRKDFASLFFALFCLAILLHSFAVENYFERLFASVSLFEARFKVEYAAMALSWVSLALFIYRLYPREIKKVFVIIMLSIGALFGIFTLVFPASVYTRYVAAYNAVTVLGALWLIIAMVAASLRGREGARVMLAGWAVMLASIVNDILHNHGVINSAFMSHFGLAAFILSQSVVLSVLFSKAFNTAEHLTVHLNDEVKEKTAELRLQTEAAVEARKRTEATFAELSGLYTRISNEVILAKSVHDRIIPKMVESPPGANIFVDSRPYMEIGGDLYDVARIDSSRSRVFLADATGHGISASFVTMLIKNEYDKAKAACETPGEIFRQLNSVFFESYRTLRVFFTGVIIDINHANRKVTYASAGHPDQFLVRDGCITDLPRTGRAVGLWRDSHYDDVSMAYGSGNRLLLFTDGIFEEFNTDREEFGAERLRDYILLNAGWDVEKMIGEIMAMMTHYVAGGLANDDMTIIGIEFE